MAWSTKPQKLGHCLYSDAITDMDGLIYGQPYYRSSTWPPLKTLACMWGAKEIATVLCAGLALRVAIVRAACFEGPPPSCFFCCPRLRPFVSLFLLFLQCLFFFSPLCSCVGQVMFGRNKIMSVTVFFLMKNVLRHGHEKKGPRREVKRRNDISACMHMWGEKKIG